MNELVGLRFRPTDEEIIMYFLERKMSGLEFPVHAINEVDVLKYEPWELPELSKFQDGEKWYFFSTRSFGRQKRNTPTGYWKITGRPRDIKKKSTEEVIGFMQCLVFYEGHGSNSARTDWTMHEFHSKNAASSEKEIILCRLTNKSSEYFKRIGQMMPRLDAVVEESVEDVNKGWLTSYSISLNKMNELVGLRFRSTDEEIIMYFLERKMSGLEFPIHAINEVNVLKYEPWELPELSKFQDDEEWYFFSTLYFF